MPSIVTALEVIDKMALKNISEVVASVNRALITAETVISGILDTTFAPEEHTDIYYLHPDYFPINPNQGAALRLSQGFVWNAAPAVAMAWSDRSRIFLASNPSILNPLERVVDYMKGVVYVDEIHMGRWISITYKGGFDDTHPAPTWLKEAILVYVPHLLLAPTAGNKAEIMAANEAAKLGYSIAAKIIEPHMRTGSFQYSPLIRS